MRMCLYVCMSVSVSVLLSVCSPFFPRRGFRRGPGLGTDFFSITGSGSSSSSSSYVRLSAIKYRTDGQSYLIIPVT